MTNSKFIDVPQEVDEWFSRLNEKDMILMVAQAIEYAAGYLSMTEVEVIKEAHELIIIEDLCASGHTV
jgi:hypothetical protein